MLSNIHSKAKKKIDQVNQKMDSDHLKKLPGKVERKITEKSGEVVGYVKENPKKAIGLTAGYVGSAALVGAGGAVAAGAIGT